MIAEAQAWLALNDSQHRLFDETVDRLLRDFVKGEDLSRRSVEQLLTHALATALDLSSQGSQSFEERLTSATATLQTDLSAPPLSYKCFVPVAGFATKDLPIAFGGIRFVTFGRSHQRDLLKPLAGTRSDSFQRLIHKLPTTDLWNSPCAMINVAARDFGAASHQARKHTRVALDCMNFFNDVIPYNHGWLYLPGEGAHAHQIAPMIASDGRVSLPHSAEGPIGPFSLESLRKHVIVLRYWGAVSLLLRTRTSQTAGDVLLTALQWAGRASVEPKRETSFLLFAIALETAILPIQGQELNYRLGLRISRLLGGTRDERSENRRIVADSYNVRSKIVHSGSYEVTDDHLGRLRWLTKRVLLRLVKKKQVWRMRPKEFDLWLEGLVVR